MEPKEIKLELLVKSLCGVILLESALFFLSAIFLSSYWIFLGGIRFLEILLFWYQRPLVEPIREGVLAGLRWSFYFGFSCLLAGLSLIYLNINFASLFYFKLPEEKLQFLFVGGVLSPIAEEFLFRGILYQYLRRWGWLIASLLSTLLFVLTHFPDMTLLHIIGGLLFAFVYEREKNLLSPIIVHILGNLGIFLLSGVSQLYNI